MAAHRMMRSTGHGKCPCVHSSYLFAVRSPPQPGGGRGEGGLSRIGTNFFT